MSENLFSRSIYKEMLNWKTNWSDEYALLVEGARRVGKSTIVKSFAQKEFRSALIIDFYKPLPGTIEVFNEYSNDYNRLFTELQAIYSVDLYEKESVIVFDEVQLYPRAREMIKGLIEDGRYKYIETGSLITLMCNAAKITIPSEEHRIDMHPMDFHEFCDAMGESKKWELTKKHFDELSPMGPMHKEMMELYKTYMVIGGMPQAISRFQKTKRYFDTEFVKKSIIDLYHEDMMKIPINKGNTAKRIFDVIPSLLSRHEKKFHPGAIKKGSRTANYLNSVLWLKDAHICNICTGISDPQAAINLTENEKSFKCYLLDTGLLLTQAFNQNVLERNDVRGAFIHNKLNLNEGMLFENAVAQELTSSGIELRFSKFNIDEKHLGEIDFIVGGKKITPIEVKSGNSYSHKSLNHFIEKNKKRIDRPFVIHSKDVVVKNNITYLPIYMAGMLGESLSNHQTS